MGTSSDRGKPPAPDAGVPKHDRSMWRGLVVSADEFAPAGRRSRLRPWVIFALPGIAIAGGIVAFVVLKGSSSPSGAPPPPRDAGTGSAQAVQAPPAPDAFVAPIDAAAPVDAAPDAPVPPDAAPAVTPTKASPAKHAPKKPKRGSGRPHRS